MLNFDKIHLHLNALTTQASQRDKKNGEHHQALFDEHLFRSRSRFLIPYVEETKQTLKSLEREEKNKCLTAVQATHLCEQLTAQMTAITREINSQSLRKVEPKHAQYYRKPIHMLYQDLAQHQIWETKLKDMVLLKKKQLETAMGHLQIQAQQELMKTEKRLTRCLEAKQKIERRIYFLEKQQSPN